MIGRPEALLTTNGAYIHALAAHVRRQRTTPQLLSEHLEGVRLGTKTLILLLSLIHI